MSDERKNSGCGLVRTSEGSEYVVVVGGYDSTSRYSTEILDLSTLEWSDGPYAPRSAYSMASVQYGDSFLLVGGYETGEYLDSVYLWDHSRQDFVLLAEGLVEGRQGVAAFTVAGEVFPTCE